MHFDMGQAWNDGVARVTANASLLAILGGVFFFLPTVVLYLVRPELLGMSIGPAGDPDAAKHMLEGLAPSLLPLFLLVILASFVGYSAMIVLIGDSRRLSVGQAIAVGFKTLLPLAGVFVMVMLGYVLAAIVLGVVLGVIVGALSLASTALAYLAATVIAVAVVVVLLMAVTRLSMTMPVIAIEGVANPIAAMKRSWAMTGPIRWRLLGFYALLFVGYMVIAMVLFMIMGLIAAALGSPALLGFLNGIAGAVVAMVVSGIVVAIYRQLAGTTPTGIRETFE